MVECRHLPKTELIGKSDPYVRVYLMPGTHAELKTKVMKKTQNPVYNDEFSFVVSGKCCSRSSLISDFSLVYVILAVP